MLECKLCDYYRSFPENGARQKAFAMCGFSGVYFSKRPEELEMEYPCARMSYGDYLNKRKTVVNGNGTLYGDGWKYAYRIGHLRERA